MSSKIDSARFNKMAYLGKLILSVCLIMMVSLGCDSECPNCGSPLPPNCTLIADVYVSECLGDVISNSCSGFFCRTESDEVFVPIPAIFNCTQIDCNSMECGNTVFTDLTIDDVTGDLTANVIQDGIDLGNAECGFFQN